jgi:MFS family permease
MAFAGCVGMTAPLNTLFYLRDLHFSAWQYGLLMGVPSIGGLVGSRLATRAARRMGTVRALWWASVLRGPWNLLIVFASPGVAGLVMCGIGFGGTLFFASLANSIMVGYRQLRTPDRLLARVATLWALATTVAQPLFIAAGGALAVWLGDRGALAVAAVVMVATAFILSRKDDAASPR